MGMIKKKTAVRGTEGGVKFVCDNCSSDITSTVRINCHVCTDYDLCVPCFVGGLSSRDHEPANHAYRVIEQHSIPIYTEDWGADEELLLLEGAETYGLGSWADIADHIGGCRTKDEVRDHYLSAYVDSPNFPLPLHASPKDSALVNEIPREQFQARKKRRIENRKEAQLAEQKAAAQPKQKPTASVPSCHEVQGFMPGRLEFETEYFNEAEEAVQHMQFDPGDGTPAMNPDGQQELELKMVIMEIYNERLTSRVERKKIIFEHNLLNYKANQIIDKKRTKEQRDLVNRAKPFARMMTHADYEEFTTGLEYEHDLRHAINTLQEWRSMQIKTLKAGEVYELEKLSRTTRPPPNHFGHDRLVSARGMAKATPPVDVPTESTRLVSKDLVLRPFDASTGLPNANGQITPPASDVDENSQPNGTNGTTTQQSTQHNYHVTSITTVNAMHFTEYNSADLHLLTPEERDLCRVTSIQPKPYLAIKNLILEEAVANGGALKKKSVAELVKTVDRIKMGKIFDFMVVSGWVGKA
ncbi:hypothetical protein EG328_006692 [Venturia inaequalis]|uniref:Transcriptional adapter 2 n=1 Tax=Venturia inaequalis TaxID=5025 RepID=A0A8H3YUL2_VENIN|nr:hypothetical protein EG328_006692 [Venturia inaequalis]KAE9976960.1 hypothetical protein EG327_007899 [Venturia inaequalis]